MLTVIARTAPERVPRGTFDKKLLMPVEVSYFLVNDGIALAGASVLLLPVNTDLDAFAHMLELWSMGTNREESGT